MAEAKNNDDNTPLHEASKCNNLDLVKDLLQHRKQSAYGYNKFGETAMVIACKYGHVETVKLLCETNECIDTMEMQQCLRLAGYMRYSGQFALFLLCVVYDGFFIECSLPNSF